jgi:hypothetical protein
MYRVSPCLKRKSASPVRNVLSAPFYNTSYKSRGSVYCRFRITGLGVTGSEEVVIWHA